jgi:hypothetical protein
MIRPIAALKVVCNRAACQLRAASSERQAAARNHSPTLRSPQGFAHRDRSRDMHRAVSILGG